MTAEHWEQVKRIVHHCLLLKPGDRDAYIAAASGGNLEIAEEAASLVAASSEAGDDFLETSMIDRLTIEDLPAGAEVGPYRILNLIGHGGMGSVYRAVRASDFEKQVSIKVVKRGMDTRFILERFRQERQILATLDHPNIARLLDGGATPDGRPYIVMEFVEGTSMTRYATERHLNDPEKLRLFQTVCSAVQHAHQNLIIHRDLKSGNILVTPEGVPKLLDFGIAKLLQPDSLQTATVVRMMTPECASPEQVRGEALNTLTDVYSLGVLLYELLTGTAPHQFATRDPAEFQRVICNVEPPKPSTIRSLHADLDTIVLKAMDKDPARRYVSAAQLNEDIERHLNGLPVIARPPTFGYRAVKFVRRNSVETFAAVLIVGSLAAGLGTTLWQARVARMERERAERRFADTHQLAKSLLFEIHDAIRDLPGATSARKLIVERALKYLDLLARERSGDPALEEDLAAAYIKVADVQGGANYANLGDSRGALASYQKALEIRRTLAATGDLAARRRLGYVYRRIANQQLGFGNIVEAEAAVRHARELDQAIFADSRRLPEDRERLAIDYELTGDLLSGNGNTGSLNDDHGALDNHRKALEINSTPPQDDSKRGQHIRAVEEVKIATDLTSLGQREEALRLFNKVLPFMASRAASGDAMARVQVPILESHIGDIYLISGDNANAVTHYRKELEQWRSLAGQDPKNASLRTGLAGAYTSLGFALLRSSRVAEAMTNLEAGERILRAELVVDRESTSNRSLLAILLIFFAEAGRVTGDRPAALRRATEGVDVYRSLYNAEPRDGNARMNLAASQNLLGNIRFEQGMAGEARPLFEEARRLAAPTGKLDGKSEIAKYVLADAYAGLGAVAARSGSLSEAQSWYRRSADVWQTVTHPGVVSSNGFATAGPKAVATELDRITAELRRVSKNISRP